MRQSRVCSPRSCELKNSPNTDAHCDGHSANSNANDYLSPSASPVPLSSHTVLSSSFSSSSSPSPSLSPYSPASSNDGSKSILSNACLLPGNNLFRVAHVNVRSLIPHFSLIKDLISIMSLDILALSETWLRDSDDSNMVSIRDFCIVRSDRRTGARGGGAALYVSGSLSFTVIDFSVFLVNTMIDIAGVVIFLRRKRLAVLSTYRPPHSPIADLRTVELCLGHIAGCVDGIICLGDLNVNMLDRGGTYTCCIYDIMYLFSLVQVISEPTRITKNSESLIDIILLSSDIDVAKSGVCNSIDISDHCVIFAFLNMQRPRHQACLSLTRDLNAISNDDFIRDINQINWEQIRASSNLDDEVAMFVSSLISIFDRLAPLTYRRVARPRPPWLTVAVRKLIAKKNQALRKARLSRSSSDWQRYSVLRNMTATAIRREKRSFIKSSSRRSSSQQFWISLSSLGGRASVTPDIPDHLLDPDLLNNHFIDSLPSSSCSSSLLDHYLTSHSPTSNAFRFTQINLADLYIIMKEIRLTSAGPYDLSGRMLLFCIPWCLDTLLHIINACLDRGVFPQMWKRSIVHPLPKSLNPSSPSSLRPISLPPFLSKLLEHVCFRQLNRFFSTNNIIPSLQSGFRQHYSTTTSLLRISDSVLRAFDRSLLTTIITLDFSKAFDTVNHDLLVAKLSYYGVSESALALLRSFLSSRYQQVIIRKPFPLLSSFRLVPSGVPQGSILGPLLFNIFVADLPNLCLHSEMFMYADDVILLKSFKVSNILAVSTYLNEDLQLIAEWSTSNALHLNPSKSSYLIVGSSPSVSRLQSFDLFLHDTPVGRQDNIKILGLHIDSSWSFQQHISVKCRAAYARLRLLYPLRHVLSVSQKLHVTQTLVLSLFDYADVVYVPCVNQQLLLRLQRVQNSCLRFCYGARKFDHVTPLFERAGWLRMHQRVIWHLCCIVYKVVCSGIPPYLRSLIHHNVEFHSDSASSTRSESQLACPSHRTSKFRGSFSYLAVKHFNSLPSSILSSSSFPIFREATRMHLFLTTQ